MYILIHSSKRRDIATASFPHILNDIMLSSGLFRPLEIHRHTFRFHSHCYCNPIDSAPFIRLFSVQITTFRFYLSYKCSCIHSHTYTQPAVSLHFVKPLSLFAWLSHFDSSYLSYSMLCRKHITKMINGFIFIYRVCMRQLTSA